MDSHIWYLAHVRTCDEVWLSSVRWTPMRAFDKRTRLHFNRRQTTHEHDTQTDFCSRPSQSYKPRCCCCCCCCR